MLLLVFSPNFPLISLLLGHRQVTIENSMLNFHVSLYQGQEVAETALEKGQLLPDQN